MCRASCKKTYKCVTRQQRMGEQSRLSTWPDVNVLISIACHYANTALVNASVSTLNKILKGLLLVNCRENVTKSLEVETFGMLTPTLY
jgi:hypothetical protein